MTDTRAHVTMLWSWKNKCRDKKQSSSNMRPTFPLVCAHWSAMLPMNSSASQILYCVTVIIYEFVSNLRAKIKMLY